MNGINSSVKFFIISLMIILLVIIKRILKVMLIISIDYILLCIKYCVSCRCIFNF